ncbi:hypothetical protein NA57DRAFT_58534 [Rhizodiscina lignyota]|uniref:Uncharacterized protein n=1 Tax=Rhizodiscina lignyota TaxID=1504668 RepID=A0A9P4IE97_9PEZI|nr:hypothetical protein NA57DRAFT_58534 [Rhizodiscina lignyota]
MGVLTQEKTAPSPLDSPVGSEPEENVVVASQHEADTNKVHRNKRVHENSEDQSARDQNRSTSVNETCKSTKSSSSCVHATDPADLQCSSTSGAPSDAYTAAEKNDRRGRRWSTMPLISPDGFWFFAASSFSKLFFMSFCNGWRKSTRLVQFLFWYWENRLKPSSETALLSPLLDNLNAALP